MSDKPTLIVASHKTNSNAEAAALEKQIEARHPEYNVVVIPQATGVIIQPAVLPEVVAEHVSPSDLDVFSE